MIAQSKGFQIDDFKIPPFELNEGDFIVLYIGNTLKSQYLRKKLFAFFSGKEKEPNLVFNEKIEVVSNIYLKGIKEVLFPTTVKKYVYRNAKRPKDILSKLVAFDRITSGTKIATLPSTSRKLISLFTTYSHTTKIIFDLGGLDLLGSEKVFCEVKRKLEKEKGAAILIDSFLGFEKRCTRFIEVKK